MSEENTLCYQCMESDDSDNDIRHYGTPRHSGRYPWGSGDNPYQHEDSFLRQYREAKASGLTDKEFCELHQMTSSELRAKRSIDSAGERMYFISRCKTLRNKGWSLQAIADHLGLSGESSVRNYLKEDAKERANRNLGLADRLEKELKEKGCLDIGAGVEKELNCSKEALSVAVKILQERGGYEVDALYIDQLTNPGQKTTVKYIALPGTEKKELYDDLSKVKSIELYSPDNGVTFWSPERPTSLDSKRIMVRYGDEGGTEKDGTIEIRRGVEDISLGSSSYAQVRIAVDGTHYMKGMAHYSDNLPDGVDIIFNTNKHTGTPMMGPKDNTVLKNLKSDPDNPFGALIKANGQRHYVDENGETKLSPINILKEQGDWNEYSKTLSSQFLSKQDLSLIKKQLKLSYAEKKAEYDSIMSLTNPAIKQKLLETFAEQCDSAAVDLKATQLPRQSTKVILPIESLKSTEIYAPTYKDGERVVLIRYPHAGTFEIPELTVNNRNKDGKSIIGNKGIDAVGINARVAERLSGADFDGDTVMVIPVNDRVKIKTSKPLKDLENFDPKEAYPKREGMTVMSASDKQLEMGKVSNLITDMTLRGATPEHLARAVKHSMVVIDAEKHELDYKRSEKENGIDELKRIYQKKENDRYGGASTLISRAGGEDRIPERKKASYKPNAETGKWEYVNTNRVYTDKDGKQKLATQAVERMRLTDDAYTLSSGHPKEEEYANYANQMKAMANTCRKEALAIKPTPKSKTAEEVYKTEVNSLMSKLNVALKNAPKERQAQMLANQIAKAKIADDPTIDKEHRQRIATQELTKARALVGANKKYVMVDITPKEWEAIQANAISTNKLKEILNNTDLDKVREYATPRDKAVVTSGQEARIKAMLRSGYTLAEVAEQMNLSTTTISKYGNS